MSTPARVVVADDEPDVRRLIALRVRRLGYETQEAAAGDEALALIRSATPALAILDGKMPGLTGLEVTRALRADPQTAHVPVILLTASAQPSEARQGLDAGADVYLTKPFDAAELARHVAGLAARGGAPLSA